MAQLEEQPHARTTVSVTFREHVTAAAVHQALDAVIDRLLMGTKNGCGEERCGVVGYDIILRGSDPIQESFRDAVREVDAVVDVSVVQGRATTI